MLEASMHSDNAFVTLTYADEHLPVLPNGLPTLVLKDAQDWLKRLRKMIEPIRVRYYLAGEYGDETERPHYHAAVFGFPSCRNASTRCDPNPHRARTFAHNAEQCCEPCRILQSSWGAGAIYCGQLEDHSAQYIAGYVTKKLYRADDPRLQGRFQEFSRMSLRPGIGADFMHEVASSYLQFNLERSQADVPSALRHGKRELPLGRYLTRRLRKLTGNEENAPQATIEKTQAEVQPVRQAAFDASESFASALRKSREGKVASWKARQSIFKTRKTI